MHGQDQLEDRGNVLSNCGQAQTTEDKAAAREANGRAMLDRYLAWAEQYRVQRKPWQAMDLYWQLAEKHPETRHAEAARAALFEIGAEHERAGELRLARGIYTRLQSQQGEA